jgi:hypothetical protein
MIVEEEGLRKAETALEQDRPGDASTEYENLARGLFGVDDSKAAYYLFLAAQYATPEASTMLYEEVKKICRRLNRLEKCAEAAVLSAAAYEKLDQEELATAQYRECISLSADGIRTVVSSGSGPLKKEQDLQLTDHMERIAHCQKQLQRSNVSER